MKTRATRGRRILEIREDLGLSQGDLARRVGVSQSTISRVESETTQPGRELVEKIAAVLGVQVEVIWVPVDANGHRRQP